MRWAKARRLDARGENYIGYRRNCGYLRTIVGNNGKDCIVTRLSKCCIGINISPLN